MIESFLSSCFNQFQKEINQLNRYFSFVIYIRKVFEYFRQTSSCLFPHFFIRVIFAAFDKNVKDLIEVFSTKYMKIFTENSEHPYSFNHLIRLMTVCNYFSLLNFCFRFNSFLQNGFDFQNQSWSYIWNYFFQILFENSA